MGDVVNRVPVGCASERWRLEAVVDRLDARIAELQRARAHGADTLDDCRTGHCRLIVEPRP